MNERIKELAKESGYVYHVGGTIPYFEFSNNQLEKFAELIVRECLVIVNRKEYSYHEADPLWETAELIKEHFGVEE